MFLGQLHDLDVDETVLIGLLTEGSLARLRGRVSDEPGGWLPVRARVEEEGGLFIVVYSCEGSQYPVRPVLESKEREGWLFEEHLVRPNLDQTSQVLDLDGEELVLELVSALKFFRHLLHPDHRR